MKKYQLSIRVRFLIGMSLMLLPLILLGGGAFYAVSSISSALEHMVEETMEELPRITHLKSLLIMAQMPPNDYLISGNPAEQNTFGYFVTQIDQALFDLSNAPFASTEEVSLAEQVRLNWRESVEKANRIFALNDVNIPDADSLMKDFDATLGTGVQLTAQLEREGYHEIEMQLAAAETSRLHIMQLLVIIGLGGLLLATVSGLLLARSVLRPLRALQRGAEEIGRGELEQRLEFSRNDEFGRLAGAFNSMAVNLERSQAFLKDMAIRDGLTGLLNRREFHQRLDGEVDRAHRKLTPLSLIMLDIDHFKQVNDTHGHLSGDEVLRKVSTILSQSIRSMDHLARYGGEEFVIVTPEPQEGTLVMAERIRKAVEKSRFMGKSERDLQVTISLGVATLPDQARTAHTLIARADEALYAAKESGRNRVCTAAGESPEAEKMVGQPLSGVFPTPQNG